jgi:hypothetical protein
VLDAQYSRDPRLGDVPEMSFWRAMDIYSDHQVRRFEESGLPIERIDSTGFMVGKTGKIYHRGMHAWKGALILMMARGGWMNTTHGNLELITDQDAHWFSRVQSLFHHLQSEGRIKSFGGIPGEVQPYGFAGIDGQGSVYVVVNPAQSMASIPLPLVRRRRLRWALDGCSFATRASHRFSMRGPLSWGPDTWRWSASEVQRAGI